MKTAMSNYKWFLNVFDQLLLPAVSLLDVWQKQKRFQLWATFKHGPN